MEGKKLLDLLIEELSSECYFEPVKENVLEEVGLKKEDVFLPELQQKDLQVQIFLHRIHLSSHRVKKFGSRQE